MSWGENADALSNAWSQIISSMQRAEADVRASPFYDSEQEKARAYLHLSRSLLKALEEQILNEVDHPYFRIMDPRVKEGGDNPDQRYLFAEIKGGADYIIHGKLGNATRLEVQIYAGRPWAQDGKSVAYLAFEELNIDEAGNFVINISANQDHSGGTTLFNPPNATTVMVRQIYGNWQDEYAGEVHIDRVGYEGKAASAPTIASVEKQLQGVAYTHHQSAVTWPQWVKQRYIDRRQANTVSPMIDTFKYGGAKGRWMASGHFNIPEGKALLIKSWPTRAQYQAIQLTDRWYASLEYANRITSLNNTQTVTASNGAIYYVVTKDDPGYPNWLDTMALESGTFLMRYDGVQGDIDKSLWPSSQLVELNQLPELIPDYTQQRITPEQREKTLAARRKHIQRRFGF